MPKSNFSKVIAKERLLTTRGSVLDDDPLETLKNYESGHCKKESSLIKSLLQITHNSKNGAGHVFVLSHLQSRQGP